MQTHLQVFAPFHHTVNFNICDSIGKGSSSNNQAQMRCMITQWGGGEGGGGAMGLEFEGGFVIYIDADTVAARTSANITKFTRKL